MGCYYLTLVYTIDLRRKNPAFLSSKLREPCLFITLKERAKEQGSNNIDFLFWPQTCKCKYFLIHFQTFGYVCNEA